MNSIRRLKDKYEDGIKELKKEQKRKELEYLKKWKFKFPILSIIAMIISYVYFFKTDNSVPIMISMYVSIIIIFMIMAVEWGFQYEYENGWNRKLATNHYNKRINTLKKWQKAHRSNNLKKKIYIKLLLHLYHSKWMQKITIVLGSTFIAFIIFSYIIFDSKENYPDSIGILLVNIVMLYWFWLEWFKKKQSISRRRNIITGIDRKRLEFLKNLLEKEKICFDDTAKIQVLIDELIRMKDEGISILKFIIQSMAIIWIPFAVVFFDHFTQTLEREWQKTFFILITVVIITIIMFVLVLRDLIQNRMNKRYNALISDLRLLQITKEEKENQSIRCMVFIHEIENLVCIRDNLKDSHSS